MLESRLYKIMGRPEMLHGVETVAVKRSQEKRCRWREWDDTLGKTWLVKIFFCNELCWGKAMVAYTKPQQRKKEECEMLRGERDQIKFIDLRFERWRVARFRKARRRQDVP